MSVEHSSRIVVMASIASLMLNLLACAHNPTEVQQSPTEVQENTPASVNIRAEDVEQIAIQEVRARQRAARELCRQSARCDSDDEGVDVDLIFGPYPD